MGMGVGQQGVCRELGVGGAGRRGQERKQGWVTGICVRGLIRQPGLQGLGSGSCPQASESPGQHFKTWLPPSLPGWDSDSAGWAGLSKLVLSPSLPSEAEQGFQRQGPRTMGGVWHQDPKEGGLEALTWVKLLSQASKPESGPLWLTQGPYIGSPTRLWGPTGWI